ncbi:hypothetical protein [Brevifollis gellanilyticus]|nr:hypothetical protein [Brevifollis gellanilyticus]
MSRILRTLAILAIVCAQVFGVQRGYSCDHGDAVVETDAEHCHRVVTDNHEDEVPCSGGSSKDCEDQGEKAPHAPVSVDLQASPASLASLAAPSYVAVQVEDFSVYDWIVPQVLTVSHFTTPPFDTGGDSLPSAAVQVVRCMVILV